MVRRRRGQAPGKKISMMCTRYMALLVMALIAPPSAKAEAPFPVVGTMLGIAGVKDGDGILIGEVEIRLQGIAAPEDRRGKVDPGGPEATAALRSIAQGEPIVCYLDGTAAGKRPVGVCEVDGVDVGDHGA